jgi:osmotically-inducible protein OsmY
MERGDYDRGYDYDRGRMDWSGYDRDYGRGAGRDYDYDRGRMGWGDYDRDYDRERFGQGSYGADFDRFGRGRYGGYGSQDMAGRGYRDESYGGYGYGRQGAWSERGQFTGRGPKGWQRTDERIREDVSERLSQHGQIDASDIEVRVSNGEVTLTGTVDQRQAKRMAEDLADDVFGVKEVHNQLRVTRGQQGQQGQQGTQMQQRTVGETTTTTRT